MSACRRYAACLAYEIMSCDITCYRTIQHPVSNFAVASLLECTVMQQSSHVARTALSNAASVSSLADSH